MYVAEAELCRAYFSEELLDRAARKFLQSEVFTHEDVQYYREATIESFPDFLIENPRQALLDTFSDKVEHPRLLATALNAPERICKIVTANPHHFNDKDFAAWDIEVISPDNFLLSVCEEYSFEAIVDILNELSVSVSQDIFEIAKHLEKRCPKITSFILLCFYGRRVYLLSKLILDSPLYTSPEAPRVFNGSNYTIREHDEALSVCDASTNRQIFELTKDRSVSGDLKTIDVERFMEFERSAEYKELIGLRQRFYMMRSS